MNNFDAVKPANRNRLGTVWNSWETQWSGVATRTETRIVTQLLPEFNSNCKIRFKTNISFVQMLLNK